MKDTLASIGHQIPAEESLLHRLDLRRLKLEKQREGHYRRLKIARRTARYLAFCEWIRRPTSSLELWPVALLILGPLVSAAFAFIVTHFVTGGVLLGVSIAFVSSLGALALLSCLLFLPSQQNLPGRIEESKAELNKLRPISMEIADELEHVLSEIQQNKDRLSKLLASTEYKRGMLLACDWKAMRGTDFEHFLATVLREQGAMVQLTKTSGDQGVDLVAIIDNRRIAIQAKGYAGSVGNAAVQQVVAGRAMYHCEGCAVITNSYFTPSAIELANAHDCTLIGEDLFARFVMGHIRL